MGFSASNTALWNPIIQLGILAAILVVSNIIQRRVPFIRRLLMPTAVLGGILALGLRATGLIVIDTALMENITYHTIALGFIALGLRLPKRSEAAAQSRDGLKSGLLIVSTYLLQAAIGLVITGVLAVTAFPEMFKAAGILLPMAYGQGPGQANNIGTTYELTYGFAGGSTFGLALATMGFLWACIGGVIYMNLLIRKKKLVPATGDMKKNPVTVGHFQDEDEIPMAESIDRMTMQIAMVLLVYLATYLVSLAITSGLSAIPALAGSAQTLSSLVWGFNFIIGSLLALLLRNMLLSLKRNKVMKRQYPNNYLLNRISGMIFDVMIIAGISAINIEDLAGLWVPFLLLSAAGGLVTMFYLRWICKRLYPGYYYEGFFAMYGMMTGTVSTGVLLLREVDPQYSSPATNNLITGTSFAILFGIPLLIFVGLAPQSDSMYLLTLGIIVLYGLALNLVLIKGRFAKKKQRS
ncbi:MAG: sodium/glutamate symporter [Acetanaerobacterium sp.]